MPMPKKPKVLLVGWDAADWEHIVPLLEKGQLPTLQRLISGGMMGNLATLQPMLSPMLWNSIATGKQPYKHGIYGFIEPDPVNGGSRPYSSVSRTCKAIWNILSQSGLKSNVINWWASHPAEPIDGCIVSNCFGGTRVDPATGKLKVPLGAVHPEKAGMSIADLRMFAEEITGEQILPFVPRAAEVDQNNDNRLAILANNLAEMLTTHSLATEVMENQPWDFMGVYFTAIDHICHSFMMYHPPKLPWINEREFEIYKDVIAGVYRFSDMTLKRMLELAGPDTTVIVCSDHGFHSRELRPRMLPNEPASPAYWHRRFGVFVMNGPGIRAGDRVVGATLLDITPTILSVFGLPIGKDMDGRVLLEVFENTPTPEFIESWDTLPGNSGMHMGEIATNPEEQEELLNQFVALGYIDAPGKNKAEQAQLAAIEAKYNLAKNLSWCGKNEEAIEIYSDLVRTSPWESRFIAQLVSTLVRAGHLGTAERVLTSAFDVHDSPVPTIRLTYIDILMARRKHDEALAAMAGLEAFGPGHPEIWNALGQHYLRLRRWDDAERVFNGALRSHAENTEALVGLSTLFCRKGDNQATVDAALRAINVVHRLPLAHLNLGIALVRSGDIERGHAALKNVVLLDPNVKAGHRWLVTLYASVLKDSVKAEEHRAIVRELDAKNMQTPLPTRWADSITLDLPDLMTEQERDRMLMQMRPPPENPAIRSGKTFILVSGLPRSGTSLMMQMLQAGGLEPKTDNERSADSDNPKGYFEWEAIKDIRQHPEIMHEPGLERKAIKAISALLPQMPYQHDYKVILMTRPIEEVSASQATMIERRGSAGAKLASDALNRELERHRDDIIRWLAAHPRAKHLVIDYPSLVREPQKYIDAIAGFIGPDLLPHPERMLSVVDKSLHRKKS